MLASRVTLNIIDPTPLPQGTVDMSDPDMVSPNMLADTLGANGVPLADQQPDVTTISFFNFAPATGGLSFYARNDVDKQIQTAIDDGAQYYTVAYSPTNLSEDETNFRNILIKLDDTNLVPWTRNGYYTEHVIKPGDLPPRAHGQDASLRPDQRRTRTHSLQRPGHLRRTE